MKEFITRTYPVEFRADEEKKDEEKLDGYIRGVGAVLDQFTDISGYFREKVDINAFDDVDLTRVKGFFNHDINDKALTSNLIPLEKKGGMEITIDKKNKQVIIDQHLNLKRSDANDLYLGIQDGVFDGMSFMFGIKEEKWEDLDTDYPTRTILKVDPVIEFSVVNYPAYKQTSIGLRSIEVAENASSVLEKARQNHLNKRSVESTAQKEELELIKIKNKNLGGR